jgi:hypothetical protein
LYQLRAVFLVILSLYAGYFNFYDGMWDIGRYDGDGGRCSFVSLFVPSAGASSNRPQEIVSSKRKEPRRRQGRQVFLQVEGLAHQKSGRLDLLFHRVDPLTDIFNAGDFK